MTRRLAASRADVLAEMREEEGRLHQSGRGALGVVGRFEYGPLDEAMPATGATWRIVIALGLLEVPPAFLFVAVTALTGKMVAALGGGQLNQLPLAEAGGVIVGAVIALRFLRTSRRGSQVAVAAGLVGAATLLASAFAGGALSLLGLGVLGAAAAGGAVAVHWPLLFDAYQPPVRVRIMAIHAAIGGGAVAGGSALTAWLTGPAGLAWRGAFLVLGVIAGVGAAVATRLADHIPGLADGASIARLVDPTGEASPTPPSGDDFRRTWSARTTLGLLVGAGAVGVLVLGLRPFVFLLLRDVWGLGGQGQVLCYGTIWAGALVGLAWLGRRGEVAFRSHPGRLLRLAAWGILVAAIATAVAGTAPDTVVAVGALTVALGGAAAVVPAGAVSLLSVVRPSARAHTSVAVAVAVVVGGVLGQQLLGSIGSRFGVRWVFVLGGAAGLAGCLGLGRAIATVDADLDAVVTQLITAEQVRHRIAGNVHLPLLQCEHIDFSYGQLQVLFDVSFAVDEGEMVALLGTNGAGKSTLLRVISGLGYPTGGSVHLCGSDITFMDPGRRVRLGVVQVPGGRAVFGPLSVLDNLRVYSFAYGRSRDAVHRGMTAAFEMFPVLGERRHQPASSLSGGEQQMLALSKALILQPRVLLIDELSLGLAPIVVSELLQMVRRINAGGTAVVLVEQSINVALSLVERAYFMEKGEVRFHGRADLLRDRPDLLRAVFLHGAVTGLT